MIVGAILKSRQQYREWLEIRGKVKADGIPKRKRIVIFDRYMLKPNVVYSNPKTGEYIWRISKDAYPDNEGRFLVLAVDDSKTYDAMAHDYITPAIGKVTVKLED